MRILTGASLAVLLAVVGAPDASAIDPQPAPRTCKVLFENSIAVHGVVRRVTPIVDRVNDPEGVEGWDYEVEVVKAYRGHIAGKRIVVRSENTTARLLLKQGRHYLVFASPTDEPGVFYARNNGAGVQGVDGEAFTRGREKKIEAALHARSSALEGEVRDEDWALLAGIPLEVSGGDKHYRVKTDAQGRFRLMLAPGSYRLHFPETLRETSYSNYGVPDKNVVLAAGQCAQIQLQSTQSALQKPDVR